MGCQWRIMTFLELDSKPESYIDMITNSVRQREASCAFKTFERFCHSKYEGKTMKEVVEELQALEKNPKFKSYLFRLMRDYSKFLEKTLNPYTVRSYFGHFKKILKILNS